MENIISYFRHPTHQLPMAQSCQILNLSIYVLLSFAAIVIFLGRAIVAHSAALRKYAIPAPVCFRYHLSLLISAIKMTGIVNYQF